MNVIYVFLSNIIMNIFILVLSAAIIRIEIKKIRIALAALIGASYSVAAIFFYEFDYIIMQTLLIFIMVLIAFRYENTKFFLKKCIVFIFSTIIIGGSVSFICRGQMTQPLAIVIPLFALIILPLCLRLVRRFRSALITSRTMRVLEIDHNGSVFKINAFEDTGNMLRESSSGLPVIVVERVMLENKIPNFLEKGIENEKHISILPFSTISGQSGALLAFKADKVLIDGNSIECLIGIYNGKLSTTNEFHALVNPLMV